MLLRPFDAAGCWYNNSYVVSSDHEWLTHGISSNKLWINKVGGRGRVSDPSIRLDLDPVFCLDPNPKSVIL